METEIWKDIEWYEWLYQVSNLWNIYSKPKPWHLWHSWKHIKTWKQWVYSNCVLYKSKKWITYTVHRLVAKAFLENIENKEMVCHKDETLVDWRLNNCVDNLFWWTRSDNMRDMLNKWRENYLFRRNNPNPNKWKYWKEHPMSRPIAQYSKEWTFIEKYESIKDASLKTWIIHQNICSCCNWKYWVKSAWWFIWKYL